MVNENSRSATQYQGCSTLDGRQSCDLKYSLSILVPHIDTIGTGGLYSLQKRE